MTDRIQAGGGMDFSADELSLLDELLSEAGIDAAGEPAIRPRAAGARVPLSFAQELLWRLDQASPGLTAYNLPITRRLTGPLDVAALEAALSAIVARHEVLRTRLVAEDGEPMQVVDPAAPLELALIDLRALPPAEREAEAVRRLRERAGTPFDLAREHPLRASLLRLADGDHVLLLETHHIACDGWSVDVLFRELAAGYRAFRRLEPPELPPLPVQYGDYVLWQRAQLSGERLARLLDFWRAHLGDAAEPLELPTDFPRPAAPTFAGARRSLLLPPELLAAVRQLAQRHDATLYMVLLAAYATVLHRYTGRSDVLIGSGIAARLERETEPLVGYINNTVIQRADFGGDPTLAELVQRIRASALGSYEHQEIPLEKLVLELREGQQRLSHTPLFEVVLTMQDTLGAVVELDGLTIAPFSLDLGATKFDLTLLPAERPEGLHLTAQYRSDLFLPGTIDRFLGHLRRVLEAMVADGERRVSAVALLTPAEEAELAAWNDAAADLGAFAGVHADVAAHAARTPDATALVCGDERLTYAELDARASRLAGRLRAAGVGRGAAVGLCLERSADAIVAMVGILKAGGAYVPLAPELPAGRLAQQVAAAGARVVVTRAEHAGKLPPDVAAVMPDAEPAADGAAPGDAGSADAPDAAGLAGAVDAPAPDDVAYILFTSGSTGAPKGVAVTHGNVANYARAMLRALGQDPAERPSFATVSTLAADLGNTAIFAALASGGALHVVPEDVATDGPRFADYAASHAVDVLKITPSHLRALMAAAGERAPELLPRRWLVVGGEACPWELADAVLAAGRCRLLNHYGPTEATIGCCTFEVTPESARAARAAGAQTVPIGRPLANVTVHVLDPAGAPAPVGVPGELWVAGAGVSAGYVGRPELTAERFVEIGTDGSGNGSGNTSGAVGRAYRTGDRVRRLPGGAIEFLGRLDDQVKVRGYRVEPGEVEAALREHAGVADAAVVLAEAGEGAAAEAGLAAFVTPRSGGYAAAFAERASPERLAAFLAERLPAYMTPRTVVVLDALPLTPNGKVDRRALRALAAGAGGAAGAPGGGGVAPRTPTEEALRQIWADALKLEAAAVGVTANFFELGGHSLVAIRILGKISRSFGLRLPLRTLFEAPTIEQLAAVVDAERASGAAPAAGGIKAVPREAFRAAAPPAASPDTDPARSGGAV